MNSPLGIISRNIEMKDLFEDIKGQYGQRIKVMLLTEEGQDIRGFLKSINYLIVIKNKSEQDINIDIFQIALEFGLEFEVINVDNSQLTYDLLQQKLEKYMLDLMADENIITKEEYLNQKNKEAYVRFGILINTS